MTGAFNLSKWLLIVPLATVALLALASTLGLGDTLGGIAFSVGGDSTPCLYYDTNGHPLMYSNLTVTGESGKVLGLQYGQETNAYWDNGSRWLLGVQTYPMYWDTGHQSPIAFKDIGSNQASINTVSLSFNTTLGFLALIISITAIAVVAGLRIFGSGTSETAVKLLTIGVGLMGLFGVFSYLAGELLFTSWLGTILYFFLTFLMTLGIILSVGGDGGAGL